MKTPIAWLAAALLLAGCAKEPELVLVAAATDPPRIAAECFNRDPAWADLPDRDVKRSEGARNWRLNKERFGDLKDARRICRASLEKQFGPYGKGRTP